MEFTLVLSSIANFVSDMDPKLGFIIIAYIFGIASFIFYFSDVVKGPTHPHPISWLIWLVTQVIATISSLIGDGGYGAYYGIFYCFTIATILFYTLFKYRWSKVNKADYVSLVVCSIGIFLWYLFNTPLVALVAATIVDAYGFDPSFRKAYKEPWSESILGWGLMIPNIVFTILALESYNELTLPYPIAMLVGTTGLVVLCWVRRRGVPKPSTESELI